MARVPRGRAWFAFFHDIVAALVAWWAIYGLRFSLGSLPMDWEGLRQTLIWVIPVQAVVCVAIGLYRGLWRYASLDDLKRIVLSAGLGALAIPLVLMLTQIPANVPRTVLLLYPIVLIFLMAGSRFVYRMWREARLFSPLTALGEPILVLGAGAAGVRLAEALAGSREWRIVGFLDDDVRKQHRRVLGVPVLGGIDELAHWVKRYNVFKVVLALPSANHRIRRQVSEMCLAVGVKALTVPSYEDLLAGTQLTTWRNLDVEDLLGREPVLLDMPGLADWLGGRVVLVTGAGGSIGSELCRQILRYRPATLVLFDISEAALYDAFSEIRSELATLTDEKTRVVAQVGDVKDAALVPTVFSRFRPDAIFHAAAYKHVPLMEDTGNAWQAVRNNTYGTFVLGQAAATAGVAKFVLISTDKAVNPGSVMGASKRLAEMVCQWLQNGATQFVMVRFGNVLNSAGSVIPKFQAQIARGGPVTVTHPDITRYFMSIPEAVGLVLQAGLQGSGGDIMVLDMGEPIRIVDLAHNMIRLSGADPDHVKIEFTGLRAGEKLHEELLMDGEEGRPTPHPKIKVAQARQVPVGLIEEIIAHCEKDQALPDLETLREWLKCWIPEYRESEVRGQKSERLPSR
ncbi:MAG: polysaccharide biosynthesis protein [Burkholderiales bacterium]|jgi:FlaA1/EpsC-like NDP-sugar epimerase|nr:polysaccharide biosynthesis protein [Burkholderiales bacterium]